MIFSLFCLFSHAETLEPGFQAPSARAEDVEADFEKGSTNLLFYTAEDGVRWSSGPPCIAGAPTEQMPAFARPWSLGSRLLPH